MNTEGPAMSFLTSCWLLPQKEQYNSFSPLDDFFSDIELQRDELRLDDTRENPIRHGSVIFELRTAVLLGLMSLICHRAGDLSSK
jgi:hypothetical protein